MEYLEYSVHDQKIYIFAWIHAIFLFLIYIPPHIIDIPLISDLYRYYVGGYTLPVIFAYIILGAFLRYNYVYHKTLKNKRMYLINFVAIALAVCVEFWFTTMQNHPKLGGGTVERNFKIFLFIGFLFFLPVSLFFHTTIIFPMLIGYRGIYLFGIKREKSESFFGREKMDPEVEKANWDYVLNRTPTT